MNTNEALQVLIMWGLSTKDAVKLLNSNTEKQRSITRNILEIQDSLSFIYPNARDAALYMNRGINDAFFCQKSPLETICDGCPDTIAQVASRTQAMTNTW
ncbi:hypothetical protein ACP3V3_03000 [Vibrio sp. PNB22_3_1]